MTTTSDTIKVSCTLSHYALEQPLGGCLFAICSIPESLGDIITRLRTTGLVLTSESNSECHSARMQLASAQSIGTA